RGLLGEETQSRRADGNLQSVWSAGIEGDESNVAFPAPPGHVVRKHLISQQLAPAQRILHPPVDLRHEHVKKELCVLRCSVAYAHRAVANVMGHGVRWSFVQGGVKIHL